MAAWRYLAIVAGVGLTAALLAAARSDSAPAGARGGRLPTPHVAARQDQVGAEQLRHYHWTTLPKAPIASRWLGVATAWTGRRLLVWGGTSLAGQIYADGASYDPSTRTWQRLPSSPLGPRTGSAYTWTGHELFVWGGTARSDGTNPVSSGALYDPDARAWRRLPPVVVGESAHAVAVWTGSRVVLLTAGDGSHVTTVEAHAYDPDRNSWTTLPSIHITQTGLLDVSALVAGEQLYVWMPVQTIGNGGLRTANDGFLYRPASNTWAATDLLPTQSQYSVGAASWTGDHVVFAPNGIECSCGGIAGSSTGSWADPRTGAVTALPAWQPDRWGAATFTWTGQAILARGDDAAAAAGNPVTARWTTLPKPPYRGGATETWTGTRLLVWGGSTGFEFTP